MTLCVALTFNAAPAATALLLEQLDGYFAYRQSRRLVQDGNTVAVAVILDFLRHAGGIPGQVGVTDFERWGAHLFSERGIAASTQRKYQATVRVFFDYLLREPRYRNKIRMVLGSDIVQVATPENCILHRQQRELDKDRPPFTQEEIELFFGAIDQELGFAYQANSKSVYAHQRDKAGTVPDSAFWPSGSNRAVSSRTGHGNPPPRWIGPGSSSCSMESSRRASGNATNRQ